MAKNPNEQSSIDMTLTESEQQLWCAQGYFVRESCFSEFELAELRSAAQQAQVEAARLCENGQPYLLDGNQFVDCNHITVQFEHQANSPLIRVVEPVNDVEPMFDELLDDPRLVLPMQSLIGHQRLALWTAKLNFKPAHHGSGFGWHQDSPYWVHACSHVDLLPNVMVALDDADRHNGCLQCIPASHLAGVLPGCDDDRQLAGFYTNAQQFDASSAVALEVPAGSCIFFSPHIVHGSGPNRSSRQRRALIATYQPAGYSALKSGQVRAVPS